MRKYRVSVLVALVVLVALNAQAQWLGSGPIYYTGGNVGIGTAGPQAVLEVKGSGLMRFSNASSLWGLIDWGPGNRFLVYSALGKLLSFGANGTFDAMTIDLNGNVGVGTTAPANLLHIYDPRGATGAVAGALDIESKFGGWGAGIRFRSVPTGGSTPVTMAGLSAEGESSWDTTLANQNAGLHFSTTLNGAVAERMRIFADGSVSIGATASNTPMAKLRVIGDILFGSNAAGGYSDLRLSTDAQQPPGGPTYQQVNSITPVTIPTSGTTLTALWLKNASNGPGTNRIDLIVDGNIRATGNITGAQVVGAVYQDVAEWVPATTKMAPGTVVVLNPAANNEVMASAHGYDTSVAGVVSAHPGVILGIAGDSKAQIATTGRVHVRVDATSAPVAIGDLLVTSDKTGMAMKSQPVDLGGIKMHRPGTLIGKALEPLPSGEGEILVLLSLQ